VRTDEALLDTEISDFNVIDLITINRPIKMDKGKFGTTIVPRFQAYQ
jgi:hypothetical protein